MGDVLIDFDVVAKMRDGTALRADVFRPTRDGPWPVLLVRSPYGKQDPNILRILDPLAAVRRGYLVVIQDTRGRSRSDGDWEPLRNEQADGYDTVRWAAALPGSNGLVGMYGPSYLGNAQWMAAVGRPPELRAIAPGFTWSEPFDGLFGRGGAIELGLSASWSLSQGPDLIGRRWKESPADRDRELTALVSEIDALAATTYWELPSGAFPAFERTGVPDLGYQRALADPEAADACRVAGRHDRVEVPAFNVGGWFDVFLQGTLDNHIAMSAAGRPTTLLVGPWSHQGQSSRQGEVNFGVAADEASIDLRASLGDLRIDWLDHWLKPGRPAPAGKPVRIFVTGINRWRDEDAWPLARSVDTPMYLREDGGLSFEVPRAGEQPDTYRYDPADPVITLGGTLLMSSEFPAGPFDQRRVEERPDVLVYTSEPLEADLEVTGRVRVSLAASSSAPSTDWVARLCDVGPDSVSRNLTDGIVRVSGVAGGPADREAAGERADREVVSGSADREVAGERADREAAGGPADHEAAGGSEGHEIDLWSIGHVFLAGHRIRVQITSSNFPRWDRNLNTGEPAETATTMRVADQTVFHDAARPSRIVLPVVPSEDHTR